MVLHSVIRRQAITHRELKEAESPLEIPREDDLADSDTARTEGSGKDCRRQRGAREEAGRF